LCDATPGSESAVRPQQRAGVNDTSDPRPTLGDAGGDDIVSGGARGEGWRGQPRSLTGCSPEDLRSTTTSLGPIGAISRMARWRAEVFRFPLRFDCLRIRWMVVSVEPKNDRLISSLAIRVPREAVRDAVKASGSPPWTPSSNGTNCTLAQPRWCVNTPARGPPPRARARVVADASATDVRARLRARRTSPRV